MIPTNYQRALDAYGRNDASVYKTILQIMQENNLTDIVLSKDEIFDLEGGNEEEVRNIYLEPAEEGIPITVEIETYSDGEENNYSLVGDTINQLDKLQLLLILENRFGRLEDSTIGEDGILQPLVDLLTNHGVQGINLDMIETASVNILKAIKSKLIGLAISNELPIDLNQLDMEQFNV